MIIAAATSSRGAAPSASTPSRRSPDDGTAILRLRPLVNRARLDGIRKRLGGVWYRLDVVVR
ncbi:hypothetical protein ABZ788_40310, partial [Streptomyces tendae]